MLSWREFSIGKINHSSPNEQFANAPYQPYFQHISNIFNLSLKLFFLEILNHVSESPPHFSLPNRYLSTFQTYLSPSPSVRTCITSWLEAWRQKSRSWRKQSQKGCFQVTCTAVFFGGQSVPGKNVFFRMGKCRRVVEIFHWEKCDGMISARFPFVSRYHHGG